MAKKQHRSSPNHSTAKKPLVVVSSPAKKPLEEVASTSKKPVEVASTSKKKQQPVVNTPPESLTDDEEMETEQEEDDENEPKKLVITPSASAPVVAATVVQSSGSESGSETDSGETDSETEPPPPPPPPVASPRTLRKRPSEVTASTDVKATTTKRAKTETEETDNTAKKTLFQRVWSEEDEIALLQGMLKFKNETGKDPSHDFAASYETVKESNYLEGKSSSQFTSKLRSLMKKYLKKKKTRTKAHDLKCLDLCKKIWGNDLVSSTTDGVSDWFERSNLVADLTSLGVVDEVAVKEKWSLVSVEMKKKLEEKWKLLHAGDFERLMLRSELVYDVSSAISNAN